MEVFCPFVNHSVFEKGYAAYVAPPEETITLFTIFMHLMRGLYKQMSEVLRALQLGI